MKIVHLTPAYEPHRGGVETHVCELNQVLLSRGHEIMVVTESHQPDLPATEKLRGVTVVRIPWSIVQLKSRSSLAYKYQLWQWWWHRRLLLTATDIVQVHDVFWWLWPLYSWVRGKVFTTFHGWETTYPVRWQAKLQRWLASRLSTGTIHVGEWIQEFYWDQPSQITYGGVDAAKVKSQSRLPATQLLKTVFKAAQAQQLVTKKSSVKWPTHAVFVGRLSADNDVQKYLELVVKLRQEHPGFKMTWIGEGELASNCQKVGVVVGPTNDVGRYVRSADLVFAASYLSILEAQALGKIVVSFYSQSLKRRYLETYPGQKFLLMSDSVESQLARIIELGQQPRQRLQLMQSAQKWALTQTWDKVADIYEKTWRST